MPHMFAMMVKVAPRRRASATSANAAFAANMRSKLNMLVPFAGSACVFASS